MVLELKPKSFSGKTVFFRLYSLFAVCRVTTRLNVSTSGVPTLIRVTSSVWFTVCYDIIMIRCTRSLVTRSCKKLQSIICYTESTYQPWMHTPYEVQSYHSYWIWLSVHTKSDTGIPLAKNESCERCSNCRAIQRNYGHTICSIPPHAPARYSLRLYTGRL